MNPDLFDPANPVVALCAEGMTMEGVPDEARRRFELAWESRRDDFDAAIAAHFVARHQDTPQQTLHWNAVAVHHAEQVPDGRAASLLPSLYLNLGDAYANVGDVTRAAESVRIAARHLPTVDAGGYRDFVAFGLRRLAARVGVESDVLASE